MTEGRTSRALRRAASLLGLIASFGAARSAAADEAPGPAAVAPRFGDRGQLILSADRLLPLVSHTSTSITDTQGDTTTEVTRSGTSIALLLGREPTLGAVHTIPRVAIDYTVMRHVTVGTSIAFAADVAGDSVEERSPSNGQQTQRETRSPRSTIIGFAPRLGYVVPLHRRFALWPRAGFAFYSVTTRSEETSNLGITSTTRVTDTVFSLDLDPQVVWLPLPNVLVHAGPLLNAPLTGAHETSFSQAGETKTRSDDLSIFHFGLSAGLGVWFDL